MDNRPWLWLLPIISLAVLPWTFATAQTIQLERGYTPPLGQSHHELPSGPDGQNGEQMMAERLRELQQLHQLQDQMQALLKDPDFVNNIKQQFDEKQLRQLREKIFQGGDLGKDNNWNKFLKQAASANKLDEKQIDLLRRWAERSSASKTSLPDFPSLMTGRNESNAASPSPSPVPPGGSSAAPGELPEKSFLDRMQDEGEKWLSEHMEGMSDDMVRTFAEMAAADEGAPLAELLRNIKKQSDRSADDLAESATVLSRHLPKVGEFLNERRGTWNQMRSLFREVSMPALPGLGSAPSASSLPSSSPDAGSWGAASLTLLTVGVFLLLVWKTGGWSRTKTAGGEADDWRLGSWPLAPDAVSTRQDLIRAFEYLALLCLGRKASTCNHRELAGRLAEQDGGNPARRQAAEMLAWLYEQARYAPADEALSPGELTDARHALRFLAGVTTA